MGITKHFCGKCGKGFANEPAYLKHVCKETGFSPREPKHFGAAYKVLAEKTLPEGKSVVLTEKIIFEAVKKARRKKAPNG